MRLSTIRLLAGLQAVALMAPAVPAHAQARFDRLAIVSTTDVNGKVRPCGCKVPKGGLPRRATFIDQTRAEYSQVAVVDAGGFFAAADSLEAQGWFLMEAMQAMRVDAVGLSERELRFGLARFKAEVARTGLPVVCANLLDAKTREPVVTPHFVKRIGAVKVGFFGLMSDQVDLGPAKDSLAVEEPAAAARRAVAELRKKGATVVVLLSQVGKVEGEDLVATVPGIDAVIIGHVVPMYDTHRTIQKTVACYAGMDGEHAGRIVLTLNPAREVVSAECAVEALEPRFAEEAAMNAMVTRFESQVREQRLRPGTPRDRAAATRP
jgi:2',3'-cyclic-nucleotide 2'-phosphodiesterase (5'-nucleotidase family)